MRQSAHVLTIIFVVLFVQWREDRAVRPSTSSRHHTVRSQKKWHSTIYFETFCHAIEQINYDPRMLVFDAVYSIYFEMGPFPATYSILYSQIDEHIQVLFESHIGLQLLDNFDIRQQHRQTSLKGQGYFTSSCA